MAAGSRCLRRAPLRHRGTGRAAPAGRSSSGRRVILHLDTSFLVDLLRESRQDETGPALGFLSEHSREELRMSLFVACELRAGVEISKRPEPERMAVDELLSRIPVIPPGEGFVALYGRTLAPLQRSGRRIATMDLLIACTALENAAPLVTGNARHFARIPGLPILDYRENDG